MKQVRVHYNNPPFSPEAVYSIIVDGKVMAEIGYSRITPYSHEAAISIMRDILKQNDLEAKNLLLYLHEVFVKEYPVWMEYSEWNEWTEISPFDNEDEDLL